MKYGDEFGSKRGYREDQMKTVKRKGKKKKKTKQIIVATEARDHVAKKHSLFLLHHRRQASIHNRRPQNYQPFQGKSSSSTFVQVKYPNPVDGTAALPRPVPEGDTTLLRSSSRKLRVSGLTASLARFFSSSTLRSKRLRLSREYISGVSLRKRLHSSWLRYASLFVLPMSRYTRPRL